MCHSGKITEICIRRLPTFCGESSSHSLFRNLFSAPELTSPTFCISCLDCESLCPFWWNVMSCPLTFSISQPWPRKAFPLFTVTQTSLSWSRMSGCLPLSRENVFLSPLPLWFWVCGLESDVRANSKGTRNQKRWKHRQSPGQFWAGGCIQRSLLFLKRPHSSLLLKPPSASRPGSLSLTGIAGGPAWTLLG